MNLTTLLDSGTSLRWLDGTGEGSVVAGRMVNPASGLAKQGLRIGEDDMRR
jgi:hypothetical protein